MKTLVMDGMLTPKECDICLHSSTCTQYNEGSNCSLVVTEVPLLDTLDDIKNLQKSILQDSVVTLRRAEALARLGQMDTEILMRLRKQTFEMAMRISTKHGGDISNGLKDLLDGIDDE